MFAAVSGRFATWLVFHPRVRGRRGERERSLPRSMCATRKRTAFTSAARSPPPPSPAHMLVSLWYHLARATIFAALEAMRIYLLPRWLRGTPPPTSGCVFYEGTVMHSRLAPEKHSFSYNVRYCLVDVCEPPASPYVASLLAAGARMSVEDVRRLSGCRDGRIRALLLPESAGYEQNPIVVYYCCPIRSCARTSPSRHEPQCDL